MPAVIQGFVITTKPKDITLESFPTVDTIPLGTTGAIVYPDLYKGVAISVAILNQDGANACQVSINGSQQFSLAAGSQFNVNDQNVISVRIVAGAAGQVDLVAQVAPQLLTTERARFAFERG